MRFGEFDLFVVSDGQFRLDGGAMFGIVPKVLWQKTNPADDRNRIVLGLNCLLIRGRGEVVVVDTGLGTEFDERFAFLYGVDRSGTDLLRSLAAAGVGPEEVTQVVLSHLHFDHAGGSCRRGEGGEMEPTFPEAVYHIDAGELGCAKEPDSRSRPSYLPHAWEPLEARGRVRLETGRAEIVPGVEVVPTPGHTAHHRSVLVRSKGRTACFLGDLVPTPSHLKTHYVMGYDLFPKTTMENKAQVLRQAREEGWLLVFEHAPGAHAGYLKEGQELEPVDLSP